MAPFSKVQKITDTTEQKNDYFNIFQKIWWFFYRKVCSNKSFSKYILLRRFWKKTNIDNPKTFNEKIYYQILLL